MRLRRIAPLVLAVLALTGCAMAGGEAPPAAAAVGLVVEVDNQEGFVIARFSTGQTLIGVDKREMGRYRPGDEIRVDSFGRPLPR
ncbi:MAG TPA: hypothetical protein VFX28_14940 [Methylomirabilota bacterium]|nr:hypothetical protein [Methylomirabilota bacterium]